VLDVDIEVDRREFTVAARFRAGPGERLALFGMSGAGKTTVLEAIAGLVGVRRGHVVVAGRTLTSTEPAVAVPVWRRRVGLLRQDPALFPHLSVRENLLYAPGAGSRTAELADLAGRLGLAGLLDARPAALSGGQAHRAALARLLLAHCDTLLLDEPYTGLDAATGRQLTMVLRELVAARGIPAVLVAHELAEAQAFADRIAVIDRGRIIQVAAPHEIVLHPAVRRVAELVGYHGFVPVTPESSEAVGSVAVGGAAVGGAAGDGEAGGRGGAVVGVHPGRVQPGAHPGLGVVLRGKVRTWRPLGAGWEADMEVGGATVGGHFAEQVAAEGESLTFTAVGAPIFGADGRLLAHSEEVRA
jgi:ABC-type sulfate/molybdate transport systems ATPase subunit